MKEFTIPMALVDFIPVIFFALGGAILMRDLYNKMSKGSYALFSAGIINVTVAGALKALYKFLYAANICDFAALDHMFFPVQSIGFLLAGVGILLMLIRKKKGENLLGVAPAVAPAVFDSPFIFVGLMVTGLGLIDTILSIVAVKMKKPWLIAIFALSFVCSLGMGYLSSSQDFSGGAANWIAECVNVTGQGTFFLGAYLMHRFGLGKLSLKSSEESNQK